MVTIKSYTDLEQSRKLAKILSVESSDMIWANDNDVIVVPYDMATRENVLHDFIPCWSLAALLSVLPEKCYPIKDHETNLIISKHKDKWCVIYWDATGMQDGEQTLADNPVDACVAAIEKLHELKML